jgi:hypothetical protein
LFPEASPVPTFLLTLAFLATDPPDNPVLAAAERRQGAFPSIELVGQIRQTVAHPGGKQLVYEGPFRVLFAGERSRVEDTRTHIPGGGTTRHLTVFDGRTTKTLDGPPGKENWKHSLARIGPSDVEKEGMRNLWMPAFLAARPLGATGWHPSWMVFERCKPTGNSLTLDGVMTEEWTCSDEEGAVVGYCWIDPTIGFVVRRTRHEPRGGQVRQTDITYAKHDVTGAWMPASWEQVQYAKDGTPSITERVTIEKVTVNQNWPDAEFDLTFPPGVRVWDKRTGAELLVLNDGTFTPFVVGPDGGPILPAPPTPPAPPPNWFVVNGPLLATVVLVAVVVGALVVRRARRVATRGRPDASG